MEQSLIGKNAGILWTILQGKKNEEVTKLKKESKLNDAEFWAAIGWLSREGKLECAEEKKGRKTLTYYSLVEG